MHTRLNETKYKTTKNVYSHVSREQIKALKCTDKEHTVYLIGSLHLYFTLTD